MTARRSPYGALAVAVVLLGTAGCAGAPSRPGEAGRASATVVERAGGPAAASPAEVLSARAQRLFAEAVQAEEEQRKLKVPADWTLLERRWRAVLDAAEVPEARFNLGVCLEGQGRLAEARVAYEQARGAKPSLRQAAVNLGVLLEKQGDLPGAQAAYAAVVREFPEDAKARERLAILYRQSGQLDDAWRLAREALQRDPRAVGAYKVLAGVALARNNGDLAGLVARRAQKLDPADPELPLLVGQALAKQGDETGAAAQYRKALQLAPGYAPAHHALLQAAVARQAWGPVAEHAKALLEADPKNAALHLALGVALRHQDQPDAALAEYARAESLAGGELPEVHLARGVLLMRVKNECEPALEEFRAFGRAAGAVAAADSPALALQRECEKVVAENRRAAETARAMQAEAERKAAEAAARKAAAGPATDGATKPTSAREAGR